MAPCHSGTRSRSAAMAKHRARGAAISIVRLPSKSAMRPSYPESRRATIRWAQAAARHEGETTRGREMTSSTPATTPAPLTGAEYLESLHDGREVYVYGDRVADVTAHPAFRNTARSVARLYDALHDP